MSRGMGAYAPYQFMGQQPGAGPVRPPEPQGYPGTEQPQAKPILSPDKKTIKHGNKTYNVIGQNPDGSYRIQDPTTNQTGTFKP
jgi:hypothetical protein